MVALATVGLLVAGCASRPGAEQARGDVSGKQGRIIEVRMVDTAFEPAEFTVSGGETVTFRFTNAGKAVHEAFIGDVQDQAAHEEEMAARMEHGGHGDDAEDALTLEPGRSGELTYTFAQPDTLEIGCHQPGHYAAGMRAPVTVT
jgi:uncharacterized cupredoxin-like copper-binding protein